MALVFHRRLAIPLWVLACVALVLTAPARVGPTPLVVLGISMIAFTTLGLIPWLRGSPWGAGSLSDGQRPMRRAATPVVANACMNALGAPSQERRRVSSISFAWPMTEVDRWRGRLRDGIRCGYPGHVNSPRPMKRRVTRHPESYVLHSWKYS